MVGDTDKDDAQSDNEVDVNSPKLLGKGILTMPAKMELRKPRGDIVNFANTKQVGPSSSVPRGGGPSGDRPQRAHSAARGNGPADPLVQMSSSDEDSEPASPPCSVNRGKGRRDTRRRPECK